MQKPQTYPIPEQNINESTIEDSQANLIPNWHKITVGERLRTRNKSENYDMNWEEIIQRLKSHHENL